MSLSTPESFEDPYAEGLNQLGHALLSATLLSTFYLFISLLLSIGIVGLGFIAWEWWQYKVKGATRKDLKADLVYWYGGLLWWSLVVLYTTTPAWVVIPFTLAFMVPYFSKGGKLL